MPLTYKPMRILEGLIENLPVMFQKFYDLRDTQIMKGNNWNIFSAIEKITYILIRLPVKDHDIKDLLTVAYIDFISTYIIQEIDQGRDFWSINLHAQQHHFITYMDGFIRNGFRHSRLMTIPPENVTTDQFETQIRQKLAQFNILHHIKVGSDVLRRCEKATDKIKKIFYVTFKKNLESHYVSLTTQFPVPEQRRTKLRNWAINDPNFRQSVRRMFVDIFEQDDNLGIFRHLYTTRV